MLKTASWVVLIAFYCVALPCAWLFAFGWHKVQSSTDMIGLWWGVVCGSTAEIVQYVFVLGYWVNWRSIAREISMDLKLKWAHSPNTSFNNHNSKP